MSAPFAAFSLLPFSFGTTHGTLVNFTVTERAWLIVTTQDPVPEQASDQPEKREPASGVARSVTFVP
jgi:hypothetical protein